MYIPGNHTRGRFVYSGPFTDYHSQPLESLGASRNTMVNRVKGINVYGSKQQCLHIAAMTSEFTGTWKYQLDNGFTAIVVKLSIDVRTPWRHTDTGLASASGVIFLATAIVAVVLVVRIYRKRKRKQEKERVARQVS